VKGTPQKNTVKQNTLLLLTWKVGSPEVRQEAVARTFLITTICSAYSAEKTVAEPTSIRSLLIQVMAILENREE